MVGLPYTPIRPTSGDRGRARAPTRKVGHSWWSSSYIRPDHEEFRHLIMAF